MNMNRTFVSALAGGLVMLAAQTAAAHDPKEHAQQNADAMAGPDCAAMKEMDMSKMDMNDPVMKAMHEKCMKTMHQGMAMQGRDHSDSDTTGHHEGDGKPMMPEQPH